MAKKKHKRVAPKDSNAHQIFIKKAAEAGFSNLLVRDFFYQINAHPQLIAFVQICQNLIEILKFPCDEWGCDEDGIDCRTWQSLCRWVVGNADMLTKAIGTEFDAKPNHEQDNPLVHKGVTLHSLYSALWNYQENPKLRARYAALQAQALLAHARVIRETHSREVYETYVGEGPLLSSPKSDISMGLGLRDLSKAVAEPELLAIEPFVPPVEFAKKVGSCFLRLNPLYHSSNFQQLDQETERRRKRFTNFVYFLQRAHGERLWLGRDKHHRDEGGGGGTPEPGYVDFQNIAQGLKVESGGNESDWYVPKVPPKHSVSKRIKRDEAPFDDGQGAYFFSEQDPEDGQPPTEANPVAAFLRARNQARHIAMANQYLPWRYESLTDQEIHNVATVAKSYLKSELLRSGSSEDRGFYEVALLSLIVLWTGASWTKAAEMRVQPADAKRHSHASLCLMTSALQDHWRVESTFPQYKTQPKMPEEVTRKLAKYLLLPDIGGLGDYILNLLKFTGRKPSPKTRLFKFSLKQYRKAFKRLVDEAGESERVTWGNWEKVMFNAITVDTGDVVDAVAITGEPHVLAQTKCFYYTPKAADLLTTYISSAKQLAKHAELELEDQVDRHLTGAKHQEIYIGSRACALKSAVVGAVSDLKSRLRRAQTYGGWADFAQYHNVFTFYTVQILAFATGYRAVKTPFFSLDEVHEQLRLTALSDKDNEKKRKTRLSYLPDVVFRQLEHYEKHLEVLYATSDFRLKRNGEVEPEPCFFISVGEKRSGTLQVRPRTMEPHLEKFLGLPANTHRRFMRTELKEAGCPPDYVNAFMGHASYGEEPWSRYSSLSAKQYRDTMAQYLEPIMKELGFVPVVSRLAGYAGR